MALQKGKRVGGAFLNLRDLAKEQGPTLVVFRIKDFQRPEKASGFNGTNVPVVADALICTGNRKGETWFGERFIGAITGPLRGVPNPRDGKDPLPPEFKVGDEIVLRVKLVNEGKSNEGAVGDEPSDPEMDAVAEFYRDGAAWGETPSSTGNGREPAAASAGKRPW